MTLLDEGLSSRCDGVESFAVGLMRLYVWHPRIRVGSTVCISRPFETIQISASDITRAPFALLHCTRSCRIIITVIWCKFVNRTVWYLTLSTRYYTSG
jgi:hypothetical protein